MTQNHRAPVFAQLQGGSHIEIRLGIIHYHRIEEKRLFVGRFAVLHIDLARKALHSVDYGGYALCDLNAFKPLPGHIAQAERRSKASHHRSVLVKHLGIYAAESKEPYLPCPGNSIGIANGYTG